MPALTRSRNDPGQYDDLAGEWWRPDGVFAMLHWIAAARARLIPAAQRAGAVLVDLGCGAGLLAPHVAGKGYRHVGVDLTRSALHPGRRSTGSGRCAATRPGYRLRDGCADVVSAGELLEHVPDVAPRSPRHAGCCGPVGLLVLDTTQRDLARRFIAVTVGERIPGGAPPGIHDPNLFVPPRVLVARVRANTV